MRALHLIIAVILAGCSPTAQEKRQQEYWARNADHARTQYKNNYEDAYKDAKAEASKGISDRSATAEKMVENFYTNFCIKGQDYIKDEACIRGAELDKLLAANPPRGVVHIGDDYNTVLKKFGKPRKIIINEYPGYTMAHLYYDDQHIILKNLLVVSIINR